jgi:putative sugar O-methyltransferase
MKNFEEKFLKEIEIKSKLKSKKVSKYWLNYTKIILSRIKKRHSKNLGFDQELTVGFGDDKKKITNKDLEIFRKKFFFLKFFEKLYLIRKILFIYLNYKKNQNYLKLLNEIKKKLASKPKNISKILLNRNFENVSTYVKFNNIKISKTYFKLLILYNITESKLLKHNKKVENIIDIGSGYGAFIDIFNILNSKKNYQYYLIDIFPINFVAFTYLRQFYKNLVYFLLSNSRQINKKFLIVPEFLFKNISSKKNSIFFNFSSFQEMELYQVKNYVHEIKKTSNSYLVVFIYKSFGNNKIANRVEEILKLNLKLHFEKKYSFKGFLNGKYQIYKIN